MRVTLGGSVDDFPSLANAVRQAGLLRRRPGYYWIKVSLTVAALVGGWGSLFFIGDSWAALGVAVFLGLVFTQLGFVGHDAGHLQVFASRRTNRLLGLVVGNALIGLSFGWWVSKHSAHHAHPNEIGRDPDVGEGLIAQDAEGGGKVANLLARHQAGLFFPLMLLRSTGLHVSGAQRLFRRRDGGAVIEGLLIAAHFGIYLGMVFWVLSPVRALAFILVQQAVFSVYLGCSFAPNHKAMPLIDTADRMSFADRQVKTARNVAGGQLTNFMLGGLNYQVEHHLFPSMPRPNLACAQPLVREFCRANDLGYSVDSLFGSYRRIVRNLRECAPRVGGPLGVPLG
jgi:fatty acid desaturase